MNNLNLHYTEISLWHFLDDINAHLALQTSSVSEYMPIINKILINKDGVFYDAFEKDELNSVQKVLILLAVAVSPYEDSLLEEKWVVNIPEDMLFEDIDPNIWWDLFEQVTISAKWYSLYCSYHILVEKLSSRNTPLFRLLYMCTCLELWRQRISPEMVAWPLWQWVHWWDLIYRMTGWFSKNAYLKFATGWFGGFLDYLKLAVDQVSDDESTNNSLRNLYNVKLWIGTDDQVSLVRWYITSIMYKK
jgi:hypothetical protein